MAELLVMLPVGRVSLTLGVDFDGWRACAGMVLLIGVLLSSFLLPACEERAVVAGSFWFAFCLGLGLGLGDLFYLSVT